MGAETALRGNADALERLLLGLAAALGDELSRLVHASLHLLLVLEGRHLGADDTNDHVLVLREELQGLEATRALGVVLKVEGVDVEVLEKLLRDDVVGTLGKMASANEVSTAQASPC